MKLADCGLVEAVAKVNPEVAEVFRNREQEKQDREDKRSILTSRMNALYNRNRRHEREAKAIRNKLNFPNTKGDCYELPQDVAQPWNLLCEETRVRFRRELNERLDRIRQILRQGDNEILKLGKELKAL